MALEFGTRIGDLDLQDWDEAIAAGFGALIDNQKGEWYLPLNIEIRDLSGIHKPIDRALVVFKRPEPTNVDFELPEIVITRDNAVPAANRRLSPVVQYRLPAPGATRVSAGGQLGWNEYETKNKARPYDFTYTIECWCRYRPIAQMLVQIVMASYPDLATVVITDSIGNKGTYAVYQQGLADITQVASMVDRIAGYALTIKVEGELTSDQASFTVNAFTGATSSSPIPGITNVGNGSNNGGGDSGAGGDGANGTDPDPGSGGLYGTGKPTIRTSLVEDV